MDLRKPKKLVAAALHTLLITSLAGCGIIEGGMVVDRGQAHLMPAAGQGAVYLRIRNGTGRADRLLRVATEAARVAEIHETFEDRGVMRMRAFPEGLEIPAGATVTFEPGGLHVMLISPTEPDARSVRLTLVFEHAGRVSLEAPLADLTG